MAKPELLHFPLNPFFTAPLFVVPWFTLHLNSNVYWLKSQKNSLVLTKRLGIHNTEILL